MKEHPIPQDITGYRFHIVGNMTLKQFGELLVATIICFLIFSTNLPAIIMWPLIVIVALLGVVAAFIPIEERPLSHWLATFYKILYKPTQFFWKRDFNIPEPFLFKGDENNLIQVKDVDLTPIRRQRIKEFISSAASVREASDFSPDEQVYMQHVLGLFTTTGQLQQPTGQVELEKPDLKVRVRSIRQTPNTPPAITEEPEANTTPAMTESIRLTAHEPTPPAVPAPLVPAHQIPSIDVDEKTIHLQTEEVAQNIDIPENQMVRVEGQKRAEEAQVIDHNLVSDQSTKSYVQNEAAPAQAEPIEQAQAAQFNADLPFPDKPTIPNKLVGMILTATHELIPSAIVEIQTQSGQVVRAVKTNALGQFFITTPLKNGTYIVNVEKSGFSFSPVTITLTGKIVDPIEVLSQ